MSRLSSIVLALVTLALPVYASAESLFGPVPRFSDNLFGPVPTVDEILSASRRSNGGNRNIFGPISQVGQGLRGWDVRLPRRGGYDFNRPLGRTASIFGPVPRLTERGFAFE